MTPAERPTVEQIIEAMPANARKFYDAFRSVQDNYFQGQGNVRVEALSGEGKLGDLYEIFLEQEGVDRVGGRTEHRNNVHVAWVVITKDGSVTLFARRQDEMNYRVTNLVSPDIDPEEFHNLLLYGLGFRESAKHSSLSNN